MTEEQFWNDDGFLFKTYQKAYTNNLHIMGHIQGLYNHLALEKALSNAFRKKGAKPEKYPEKPIFNPYLEEEKKKGNEDSGKNKKDGKAVRKIIHFWGSLKGNKKKGDA